MHIDVDKNIQCEEFSWYLYILSIACKYCVVLLTGKLHL